MPHSTQKQTQPKTTKAAQTPAAQVNNSTTVGAHGFSIKIPIDMN